MAHGLNYSYGRRSINSDRLFGVSLYQQKSIELRPSGREPFSASSLLDSVDHPHSNSPYLSQIPCSWGAVYFPEHWRLFHAYLIDRLSEHTYPIDTPIISPSDRIRSNRWTRSWKKFFNEFVYLHGYVMLYPNYSNWTALSTNHLEVGVHVRGREPHFQRKREQFDLPLMPLPIPSSSSPTSSKSDQIRIPSILDLPLQKLPPWDSLPVIDLWGFLSSHDELRERGVQRYKQLIAECYHSEDTVPGPGCQDSHDATHISAGKVGEGESSD